MDKATAIAKIIETFPNMPEAQLNRLLSPDMPEDERDIILKSWNDAAIIPGPDGWTVFLQILKAAADIANLVMPIEGAVQGIVNIGHG